MTIERRLAPRLRYRTTTAAWVTEHFKRAPDGPIFAVMDLSLGGMAVQLRDEQAANQLWSAGSILEGELKLAGQRLTVQTRVVRLLQWGDSLGLALEFQNLPAEAQTVLESYLSPKNLGSSLKPVPVTHEPVRELSSESALAWTLGAQVNTQYQGLGDTWVRLLRGMDGDYTAFEIELLGQVLSCDALNYSLSGGLAPELAVEFLSSANLPANAAQWMIRKIHGSKLRT